MASPKDELGVIVGKIRNGGDQYPACALLDELDEINDYSRDYHHAVDPTKAIVDGLNETELKGYVRCTLKIVKSLQT